MTATLRRCGRGLLALALGACEGDPSPPPAVPAVASLVEREAWERVDAVGEDVFGAERPEGLVCDEVLGIGAEMFGGAELVLEIDTDFCDYATVAQPSLHALAPGDAVTIQVWHYELTTPAPAQAHLALAIDGEVAWEVHVDSPTAAALVEGEIAIDRDVPAGVELQFHVHNHGANSYDLLSLEVVRGDAPR
jgi:hypothetical protein